jgi:Ca-activated chloride channel homolog
MSHEIDEVRLTAFALGELEPADAAEVEAQLASNPAARAEVDAIRAFAGSLETELAGEKAPGLTKSQKHAIADAAVRPSRSLRPYALAAAALIAVILVIVPWKSEMADEDRAGAPQGRARHSERFAEAARTNAAQAEKEIRELDENRLAGSAHWSATAKVELKLDPNGAVVYTNVPVTYGRAIDGVVLGVPGQIELGDFDVEIAQAAVIADPIIRKRQDAEDPLSVESYSAFKENPFVRALGDDARSTFALDVDTASYSNIRRLLRQGARPDKGAVRLEEMINYFEYDYPAPKDGKPLAVTVEVGSCPWAPAHRLALVGLKAKPVAMAERGRANLVFLIDVSGSMQPENKLPLVKKALRMLLKQLRGDDRVALVVYAGNSGLVLPSTTAHERGRIEEAIANLDAGGSTNGAQGIELAYSVAKDNFVPGGVNRVILCTDGDFNVGVTSESALVELIEAKAKTGVFLTALGFGMGNLKDSTLQKLANKGNGNYGYVDDEKEAKKLLVDQVAGTLVTVAKDARIQVEFNPARVGAWRLVGYEKRVMPNRDFHNDAKDAGEVGSGHTVTALYEIIPAGSPDLDKLPKADPLRYQGSANAGSGQASADLMTVALRYKEPEGDQSTLVEQSARDEAGARPASGNFRLAAAVAMFGMELRGSEHKGLTNWALVDELAREAKGADPTGLRAELVELIAIARGLAVPK